MMLLLPFLGGGLEGSSDNLLILLMKEVGVILALIVAAKWVVPWLLFQVTRTGNRELFLLTIVMIGLAVAWLTHFAGLSLAVGAFLAGLVISESEYSHQAMGNIIPFRDIFTSFFFISIGMLLNIGFLVQAPVLILALGPGPAAGQQPAGHPPDQFNVFRRHQLRQVQPQSFLLRVAGDALRSLVDGRDLAVQVDDPDVPGGTNRGLHTDLPFSTLLTSSTRVPPLPEGEKRTSSMKCRM